MTETYELPITELVACPKVKGEVISIGECFSGNSGERCDYFCEQYEGNLICDHPDGYKYEYKEESDGG